MLTPQVPKMDHSALGYEAQNDHAVCSPTGLVVSGAANDRGRQY